MVAVKVALVPYTEGFKELLTVAVLVCRMACTSCRLPPW